MNYSSDIDTCSGFYSCFFFKSQSLSLTTFQLGSYYQRTCFEEMSTQSSESLGEDWISWIRFIVSVQTVFIGLEILVVFNV